MCVRGSNWRKINRCEEEQTDVVLSEVVGVVAFGRESMWKSTPATPQSAYTSIPTRVSFQKEQMASYLHRPSFILLRGMRENETVTKKQIWN